MPGKKYKSLKAPGLYEKLRDKGFSKSSAAALSNWIAKRRKGKKKGKKKR
jgi:hypothetical protein